MAKHNILGEKGEQMATEYLLTQGYIIHQRDKRMGHEGEIDIIAFKDNEVIFIEVKTRTESDTDPMEVVDNRRRARICRAADDFINHMEIDLLPRFDIIIVNFEHGGKSQITHYPDAYIPSLNGRGV